MGGRISHATREKEKGGKEMKAKRHTQKDTHTHLSSVRVEGNAVGARRVGPNAVVGVRLGGVEVEDKD